jgi:hypothetical protein
VIGSYRRWLGHDYTKHLIWYAAVNPTGAPYQASRRVDDLPSRRAAIRWLLTETGHDCEPSVLVVDHRSESGCP